MDSPGIIFPLIGAFVLIFANGFFILSETALVESHKNRLEKLTEAGTPGAQAALLILENPAQLLLVVQIGITFTSILNGVLIGALITPILAAHFSFPYAGEVALALSIIFITYLHLLIGEVLPQKISMQNPERYLMKYHTCLTTLELITRPAVACLTGAANFILLLIGINPQIDDSVTEDEVKDLIDQATEDGTLEKMEQTMVDHIFHMSDQTAYALMTPRTQVTWIDLEDSLAHNLSRIVEHDDTIYPVGRGSLDDFAGILHTKDLLTSALEAKDIDLILLLRTPLFVPRSMETFRVLEKFRESGTREAVVLDEYGGVIGFLTLDDIVEAIIGDTTKANEPDPVQLIPRSENSWFMDGLYSIDDFKGKFDLDELLPDEEKAHFQTMGGFLTSYFGYIPKVGEKCTWRNFDFEIIDMDRARIDKVIVTHHEPMTAKSADLNK
ncbi:hemolysin family protein [Selenomonas sp. TAMA-11512]|uniref:hemolysin family protein n=1 Tax=Selenomonas sp. TAMA-11512 TaxID=3095337 RepID=UPI003089C990|nr:hemolysin family protein [Selenomonas sp. TAMA-11512]